MCLRLNFRLLSRFVPACLLFAAAQRLDAAPATNALATLDLQHLSLAAAQEFAFERNWDLLAAVAGVDAASAQKIVAKQFPNPTFAVSTSDISVDNHPNSTPAGNGLWDRSYDTIFAINQLFEIGGKRKNRRQSAEAGLQSARAQLLDTRRTLDLGIAKAYIAAELAEENARVLLESAATLREEARLAGLRLQSGEISSADRNQIEISAERFESDAEAAKTAAAQARVALEVLLGLPHPNADCSLSDKLEQLIALAGQPRTNATGEFRADVVAAQTAWEKSEADWRLQKSNRIPDPTVSGQYEHNPPDFPNTVGFGVSLPLPLWNRNRGNILAADAAREQARLAYEKAKAQAQADIATAVLGYEDAAHRWERYRDNIRPKSDQVRRTKAYAYQKGAASLLDMLVAERDDNDVRMAASQAASDTANSLAALQAASQEIKPAEVKK